MAKCEVCGNEYDKVFRLEMPGDPAQHLFDSFECAIHALAPACAHCGCTILGHGTESDGNIYCCARCAAASGVTQVKDRADTPGAGEEGRPMGADRSQRQSEPDRRETRRGAAGAGARRGAGIAREKPGAESDLPPRGSARLP